MTAVVLLVDREGVESIPVLPADPPVEELASVEFLPGELPFEVAADEEVVDSTVSSGESVGTAATAEAVLLWEALGATAFEATAAASTTEEVPLVTATEPFVVEVTALDEVTATVAEPETAPAPAPAASDPVGTALWIAVGSTMAATAPPPPQPPLHPPLPSPSTSTPTTTPLPDSSTSIWAR